MLFLVISNVEFNQESLLIFIFIFKDCRSALTANWDVWKILFY